MNNACHSNVIHYLQLKEYSVTLCYQLSVAACARANDGWIKGFACLFDSCATSLATMMSRRRDKVSKCHSTVIHEGCCLLLISDQRCCFLNAVSDKLRGGSTLMQGRHVPPDSLVASSQIQKLADRSDVISEVPKCSKIQVRCPTPP